MFFSQKDPYDRGSSLVFVTEFCDASLFEEYDKKQKKFVMLYCYANVKTSSAK